MLSDRLTVEIELTTLEPLHIGSGIDRVDDRCLIQSNDCQPLPILISPVVRDHLGWPYIPGSTIKGLLRSLAQTSNIDTKRMQAFFGSIGSENGQADVETARMALLYCRNAYINKDSIPDSSLPNYHKCNKNCINDPECNIRATAVVSRTAIDQKTGGARNKHLFRIEIVPPETSFKMKLIIFEDNNRNTDLKLLEDLIQSLSKPQGIILGANQRSSMGRIKANIETLTIQRHQLNVNGDIDCQQLYAKGKKICESDSLNFSATDDTPGQDVYKLLLEGKGPFLVMGEQQDNINNVLEFKNNKPWLPGSSLLGALRADFAWMLKREMLKPDLSGAIDPHFGRDNQRLTLGLYNDLSRHQVNNPNQLSPTERLFGVTGWRGLLEIVAIKLINEPEYIDLTSVKLDRFSGTPIDGALFTNHAVLSPEFTILLRLDTQRSCEHDYIHFQQLLVNIEEKGLTLGRGSNQGFGWFIVTNCQENHHAPE